MRKHYLVYKTTNLVNGKIYIGQHQTYDLNDGYLGSGKLLKQAIKKYGEQNFKREILCECSSLEEMNEKEAEIVNDEFIQRNDTYNIKHGGEGGWDFINVKNMNNSVGNAGLGGRQNARLMNTDPAHKKDFSEKVSNGLKKVWEERPEVWANVKHDTFKGHTHTKEARMKISEAMKQHIGEKNNAWGTKWIHNETLRKSIRIKKELVDSYLREGWKLGAVYEWTAHKDVMEQ